VTGIAKGKGLMATNCRWTGVVMFGQQRAVVIRDTENPDMVLDVEVGNCLLRLCFQSRPSHMAA